MVFTRDDSSIRKQPGFNSLAVVIAVLIVSIGIILFALTQQRSVPTVTNSNGNKGESSQAGSSSAKALSYSKPVSISISSVGINSEIIQIGKASSGILEVPEGDNYNKAAWYKGSPAPGQAGAAIVIGHVDSYDTGASVFFELANVKSQDSITINRQDGTAVTFRVYKVRQYERQNFPTKQVYIAESNSPELRLITCGGEFSPTNGSYESNIVVYARKIE